MKALGLLCCLVLLFSCARGPSYRPAPFDGRQVSLDIRLLREGVPEFYTVTLEGKQINFFLLLLDSGISSYFAACKECHTKKLGYRHEGGEMVCRACNVRFPLEKLDTGIGGCYPISLRGGRVGDSYILSREALEAGKKYF